MKLIKSKFNFYKGMPYIAYFIMQRFEEEGHQAYLIGGVVRDLVLGRDYGDIDIVTDARPEEVAQVFTTVPVGEEHGVVKIKIGEELCDCATMRKDMSCDGRHAVVKFTKDLAQDLARRDFTINAMAMDIAGCVYTLKGTEEHLEERKLHTVGAAKDRFEEDHLRMLRAVRFAVACDFKLSLEVVKAIADKAHLVNSVSAERVRDELFKILGSADPVRGIRLLLRVGLLEYILPEVYREVGWSQQSPWHNLDVFEHSLDVLDKASWITTRPLLRFIALIHDIGKVPTRIKNVHGNYNFYGHDKVGAEMAQLICKRLKLSKKQRELVFNCIKNHLALKSVQDSNLNKKTIARYIRRHWDYLNPLLLLAQADWEKVPFTPVVNEVRKMITQVKQEKEESQLKCLVTGTDLMELFQRGPGAWIRPIKEAVLEEQIQGSLKTRDEAVQFVKERLCQK